ncbi:hypothetical protein [Halopseudomonas bauzanensis]|uniref:hypothetical protein n=1 Tax=Halopseudomonas bauzanensis TaxID=653930 RepID=UPI0025522ABA|nr:hypothetical protein [Halopseudomonas bauzanensis]
MSTFAVFGMTRDFAMFEARKKTPTHRFEKDKAGNPRRVELTQGEWEAAVIARAESIMEGARVVQLCRPFDAPQFAKDFVTLVRRRGECRDLDVRARVPDKSAPPNKRTGKPVMTWKPLAEIGLA